MTPEQLKASILQYAIQGKLVEQRAEEGTGEELYQQIQAEKQRLIKEGKIKKEKPLPEIAESEIPFDIPESWKWARIGQIFNLQAGKNITSADIYSEASNGNRYLCYGGNGCRGYVSAFNRDGYYALIGRQGALCGNINVAEGQFYATEHAIVVEHFNKSDVLWCAFFLKALNLNQYATATAQPGLAVANIIKVPIPLPPLAEQKRIVAKIEELLPLVDRYAAVCKKLEQFNAKFPEDMKKSVLQYAIQGKLVEQRAEEGTGEELYRQIQEEKKRLIKEGKIKKEKSLPEIAEDEIPFDIPESWRWLRLGDCITLFSGTDFKPEEYNNQRKGTPYITGASSLTDTGVILNRWTETPRIFANLGDVLLVCKGSGYGKTVICDIEEAHIARQIMAVKKTSLLSMDYVRYFLNASFDLIKSKGQGVIPGIDRSSVLQLLFPLPPLAEQKRIVAKIEELLPLCERLK